MRLEGKVIIITGSTTGIGKAIALRCVAEGARVVLHGLEADWGREVLGEIGNDKAVLHIQDISEEGTPDCASTTASFPIVSVLLTPT